MSESHVLRRKYRDSYFTAISAGFFFILVGMLFVVTPNLYDSMITFFRDFDVVTVPTTDQIRLIAPASPNAHLTVYAAVGQFSLIWGLFQIAILALRFVGGSPLHRKAETVSHAVFWLGTSYLISKYLNETTTLTIWFVFWAMVIMLLGLSMIVRAVILATRM